MDEHGFSYQVQPPGPPFDKHAIPLIGDAAQQELIEEMQSADLSNSETMDAYLQKNAALRRAVPFREYVERAEAIFIAPHHYSYGDLTLVIAQQLGSSHEDSEVDESLVQMASLLIGGHPSHLLVLAQFANLVIHVGQTFLGFLIKERKYSPAYFQVDPTSIGDQPSG